MLCGAGFETPAEALFLKKKLMVIPMKGQYEQQCNAAALKEMGVPVLKKLKLARVEKIIDWVTNGEIIPVDYPNITGEIIDEVFEKFTVTITHPLALANKLPDSDKKIRQIRLGNILHQITG